MIIKFTDQGNLEALMKAIKAKFPGAQTLQPLQTEHMSQYTSYNRVLFADASDEAQIRATIQDHGFTVAAPDSQTVAPGGSDAEQKLQAANFYFTALRHRGSFGFTSKEYFDKTGRFDDSFLHPEGLLQALPQGFSNWREPEWYWGNSSADPDDFITGYISLFERGFVELVHGSDEWEKRDPAQVRAVASRYYFIASKKYGALFTSSKAHWDEREQLGDSDYDELRLALPSEVLYESEDEWSYLECAENPKDLENGRRLMIAAGFTELDESLIP
jgi:hypothetical protein